MIVGHFIIFRQTNSSQHIFPLEFQQHEIVNNTIISLRLPIKYIYNYSSSHNFCSWKHLKMVNHNINRRNIHWFSSETRRDHISNSFFEFWIIFLKLYFLYLSIILFFFYNRITVEEFYNVTVCLVFGVRNTPFVVSRTKQNVSSLFCSDLSFFFTHSNRLGFGMIFSFFFIVHISRDAWHLFGVYITYNNICVSISSSWRYYFQSSTLFEILLQSKRLYFQNYW